jgi:hypothetical protein
VGPEALVMLASIIFTYLAFSTYNSNPKRRKGSAGCSGCLVSWFVMTLIVYFIDVVINTPTMPTYYEDFGGDGIPDPYIGALFLIFLFMFVPFAFVAIFNFEGLIITFLRFRYAFNRDALKEATMVRDKEKQLKGISDRQEQIEHKLVKLTEQDPGLITEVMQFIPKDTGFFKGYFGEVARRFKEGQVRKTIQTTRERVEEVKKLTQEYVGLQRSRVDLERAKSELGTIVDKKPLFVVSAYENSVLYVDE